MGFPPLSRQNNNNSRKGIPKFDPSNKLHQKLSGLSKNAHYAASIGDEAGLRELEEGIDEDAAQIWGLTKEELKKIQTSLAELV